MWLELFDLSPALLLVRAVAALSLGLVIGLVWHLMSAPIAGGRAGLMRAEVLVLGGVLAFAVLFFERVALRLIRTRGGRVRGPRA